MSKKFKHWQCLLICKLKFSPLRGDHSHIIKFYPPPSKFLLTYNTKTGLHRYSYKKGFMKICSKSTGEHPCQSVISINLQINFIEIILWHGYSPVNLLHIFRIPFPRNTCGGLLLTVPETMKLGTRKT